jgi:hypothetical protein
MFAFASTNFHLIYFEITGERITRFVGLWDDFRFLDLTPLNHWNWLLFCLVKGFLCSNSFPLILPENRNLRNYVNEHHSRVSKQASTLCRIPKAKIIRMPKTPSEEYIPGFTILHRCENDSSCCADDNFICTNKSSQQVHLPYIKKIVSNFLNFKCHYSLQFSHTFSYRCP